MKRSRPQYAKLRITRHPLPLSRCLHRIETGDFLLFREADWLSQVIAWAGRGEFCHAAMAVWLDVRANVVADYRPGAVLICAEVLQGAGAQYKQLAVRANTTPGGIDVFKCREARYDRLGAGRAALAMAGSKYGWLALSRVALRHTLLSLILRWPADDNDDAPLWLPPFCSGAVSDWAYRGGGIDPVLNMSPNSTEPTDLAHGRDFTYELTLADGS